MKPRRSNLPQAGVVLARQVIPKKNHQVLDHFLYGFVGL
jgi:hypothetical protein